VIEAHSDSGPNDEAHAFAKATARRRMANDELNR